MRKERERKKEKEKDKLEVREQSRLESHIYQYEHSFKALPRLSDL